jgi:hypothetical protein
MSDNFSSTFMRGYGENGGGTFVLGSTDNGKKALGMFSSVNISAAALVSLTGLSRLWLFVKHGSSAVEHIKGIDVFRKQITFCGNEFDSALAFNSLIAQNSPAVGLLDNDGVKKVERKMAWSFAHRNGFGFYGPLGAIAKHYWQAAEEENKKPGIWNWLNTFIQSSDDTAVVNAILNGLVALGADALEEKIRKEIAVRKDFRKEHPDWRWVTSGGSEAMMEPKEAARLVAMGGANYLDGEKPEPRITNPMHRREDDDCGGASWIHAQQQREEQNENHTSWAMQGHKSHAFEGKETFDAWASKASSALWKPKG